MADTTISVEMKANTAAAVTEVRKLNDEIRDGTTAATVAGSAQQQLGKDVAVTSARVRDSAEAARSAKQALETHNATVSAFGANSTQAAQSGAKLAAAEREAAKAANEAAAATTKLAKEVQAVAAAEDGQLSPATKRAAAQVAKMGETVERTAHELNKMELQQKRGAGGFDLMGLASGKLMSVLGPAALGGTLVALAGWLGETAGATLQYETALANLPYTIDAARKSTHGLISDQALVSAAANASALKVANSADEFAGLADAVTKLAKPGQDVSALLNEITGAIGRGSSESLNNVNVILTQAEAQARYAATLGVTVAALTDEQKATAFKVEGLKAVIAAADATKYAYDGNAAAVVRLKVATVNAWDSIERAAVNGTGSILSGLQAISGADGALDAAQRGFIATALAMDTTWSPAFKTGATEAASWAAEMLGVASTVEGIRLGLTDPAVLASMDAANERERTKRDILSEEADFSERMAKAAAEAEKSAVAFRDQQAASAVMYGPAAPDKKRKGGAKKKAGDMLDPGDVAIARTFDGVEQTELVSRAAPEAAAEGRAEREAQLFAERELRYEREAQLLDAQGQAESERIDGVLYSLEIEDEAENRRRELQDQRLNREQEYERWQVRNARTEAQREQAQTRLEAVEHRKRIVALTRAAEEERAVMTQRRELVATVAGGVNSLAGSMLAGIEGLVNGQRGALAASLADWTKDLAVRMGLKSLEEFVLAAAATASYNFPAAAAHTAAGGMALGVAAAAGGASAGLSAAASAAGGGGGPSRATGGAGTSAANGPPAAATSTPLERLDVPVSYARPQDAGGGGIVININVAGPVGKNTVQQIGETVRRAIDKTKAQGART